jgi:signal transduction histidine kinase
MELGLFRNALWLVALAAAALVVREFASSSPAAAAVLGFCLSAGLALLSYTSRVNVRLLGGFFFVGFVGLITKAALDLGGASGSALSFAFIPGLLATLTLGPRFGWTVTGLMLLCVVGLGLTTPLDTLLDRLRFIDELSMIVFATGLAHTLVRSFRVYETAIEVRRDALAGLEAERQAMAHSIYDELEPAALDLVDSVPEGSSTRLDRNAFEQVLARLGVALRRAKPLAQDHGVDLEHPGDPDLDIRRTTMRVWLRLGAALMAFFAVRNAWLGAPFTPSLVSFGCCFAFDYWLGRAKAARFLELTAFGIGLVATGPMIVYVALYGGTPSAPALVVTPATVLFTALLSRGRAAWAIVGINLALLAWVGLGRDLPLRQSRLLGDLILDFVFVVLALRRVFALRESYARTLVEQTSSIAEALRVRRRLAGTLFHDASNHLQAILLYSLESEAASDSASARSLSRRVQRLIGLSKRFLTKPSDKPRLTEVSLKDAFSLLSEAFGPHLKAKNMRLEWVGPTEFEVRIEPELFIESVLGNLVSNAVKFSPAASTITLSAERQGDDICIRLKDSGPGFPEAILKAHAGDGALPTRPGTAGEQGQGYGLRLAREHVERMGGRLEFENLARGGAECRVWLLAAEV